MTTRAAERGVLRYLWAALLTVLCPGSGQVYAGRARRGWVFAIVVLACLIIARLVITVTSPTPVTATLFLGATAAAFLCMIAILLDAIRLARQASLPFARPWTRSVWLLVAAQYMLYPIAFGIAVPGRWKSLSIPSASSEPTLLPGDDFFADMTAEGRTPHVGDMMAFLDPRSSQVIYIKRVVGLGGDRVQMKGGVLYLNGVPVPRDPRGAFAAAAGTGTNFDAKRYTETLPNGVSYDIIKLSDEPTDKAAGLDANNTPEYLVPAGYMFMLGDSRDNSMDSRFQMQMGYVPVNNAIGRAGVVYFSIGPGGVRWNRVLHAVR